MKISPNKYNDALFSIFRVLIGSMFIQHGAQKLFGSLGAQSPVPLFSLFGLAGILEFFGGILIVIGLFTRLVATITAIEMVVAYFMVHIKAGFYPILNGGELAILFLSGFLVLIAFGGRRYSLDNKLRKKST